MPSNNAEDERRVLAMLDEALLRPQTEQVPYVRAKAGNDEKLMRRVLNLLMLNGKNAQQLVTGGASEADVLTTAPEEIGGYSIVREIGHGGMGTVYLGQRVLDGVSHLAAIKIVQHLDTIPRLSERLRQERRTLAQLRHPHIAQLYDWGQNEEEGPYFVMEYVEGVTLDQYISEQMPSLKDRLAIFRDICDAISYAHGLLTIHRDLTPRNILISNDGVVKLVDFGISQSLDQNKLDPNAVRRTRTEGYASPEQVAGESPSVSMDIFSLGVILNDITDEITVPRRDDLNAIIEKATMELPEKRYLSVSSLKSDIDSYALEEPVSAMGSKWRYILKRQFLRRKLVYSSAFVAGIGVLAASIAMTTLYLRADAAEKNANSRLNQVRSLTNSLIFDIHDEVAALEGSTKVRSQMTALGLEYIETLDASENEVELSVEIALAYKKLSDVTGNPGRANLGDREAANELLQTAVEYVGVLIDGHSNHPAVQRAYVEIMIAYARDAGFSQGDPQRAVEQFADLLPISERLVASPNAQPKDILNHADAQLWKGYFSATLDRFSEEPLTQIDVGRQMYQALVEQHPDNTEALLGLGRANTTYGEALSWHLYSIGNDTLPSLPHFDRGVEIGQQLTNGENASIDAKQFAITSLFKRANTTCYISETYHQALADLDEAQSQAESLLKVDPFDDNIEILLGHTLLQHAECLSTNGAPRQGLEMGAQALARREAIMTRAPDNPMHLFHYSNVLYTLFYMAVSNDLMEEACAFSERLEVIWDRLSGSGFAVREWHQAQIDYHRNASQHCHPQP